MVYICEDETRYTISVQEIEDKNCVNYEIDCSKPIVLVTNGDGIGAIGLTVLVEALVGVGLFNVHVYTPQLESLPDRQDFVGIITLFVINSTISFIEENNAGNAQLLYLFFRQFGRISIGSCRLPYTRMGFIMPLSKIRGKCSEKVAIIQVFVKWVVGESGFCSENGYESNVIVTESIYHKVTNPTLSPIHLQDLPGFTRSVYQEDHAVITRKSCIQPSPDWSNTMGVYLITHAMGSHFVMYLAKMQGIMMVSAEEVVLKHIRLYPKDIYAKLLVASYGRQQGYSCVILEGDSTSVHNILEDSEASFN
ncbi:hypothetical protein IFM89_039464 [Coptis chinensis]|uniref:Uncharacterized protein n=1 Tax=Coptis chinensis TaxID=261450 RepID=A0A835LQ04_9MAGN|nr:hypothetical protein IFM89_039464 [Coptis chinensis]